MGPTKCRKGGAGLKNEGRVVNGKKVGTEGPFVEAKEIVGGFTIVKADSLDAAAEIAKACPCLHMGGTVEVRPLEGYTIGVVEEYQEKTMENKKQPTLASGKVCYIEMPAIDVNCSASFYKAVFGWRIRQRGDGLLAFDDTAGEVSGTWVLGRPAATEPGLLIYIMVDSVATTALAVIAHGGKIVQPIGMDAPEITARFSDPAGNVIGLYQQPTGEKPAAGQSDTSSPCP